MEEERNFLLGFAKISQIKLLEKVSSERPKKLLISPKLSCLLLPNILEEGRKFLLGFNRISQIKILEKVSSERRKKLLVSPKSLCHLLPNILVEGQKFLLGFTKRSIGESFQQETEEITYKS